MGDELYVEGMDDAFLEWRAQHGQEWARYYGLTVSQPPPELHCDHSLQPQHHVLRKDAAAKCQRRTMSMVSCTPQVMAQWVTMRNSHT